VNNLKRKTIVKCLVSVLILSAIIYRINWSELASSASKFNLGLFILAGVFMALQILFLSFRWHVLINCGRKKLSLSLNIFINLASYFANLFFFASLGGVIAKSGLSIRYGVSMYDAIIASLLDRFLTLFALICLSAVGLVFLHGILSNEIINIMSAGIFFMMAALAICFMALYSQKGKNFIRSKRKRMRIILSLRTFLDNVAAMVQSVYLSIFAQISFILAVYILSFGIDAVHNDAIAFLSIMPILALISSLPISFGGWGVREGAFVYGLGLIGFSTSDAFLLSVQVGLMSLIVPVFFSVPYLMDASSLSEVLSLPQKKSQVNK